MEHINLIKQYFSWNKSVCEVTSFFPLDFLSKSPHFTTYCFGVLRFIIWSTVFQEFGTYIYWKVYFDMQYMAYDIISYCKIWPWTYFHSKKVRLSLQAANFSTLACLHIFKYLWFTFSLTPHQINQTGSCLSHPPCHIVWIGYIPDMLSLYLLFSPSKNAKVKCKWKQVYCQWLKKNFSEETWNLGSHRS